MCNDGYKLVGSLRNRCQQDGSWRYGGENLPVCTLGEVLIIIELLGCFTVLACMLSLHFIVAVVLAI